MDKLYKSHNQSNRYYISGLVVALLFIVASELIWLPAPLRTSNGMQWIEMIDRLFYLLALVPLSWALGAGLGFWQQWRGQQISRSLQQQSERLNDSMPKERERAIEVDKVWHTRRAKLLLGLMQLLRLCIIALSLTGASLVLFAPERLFLLLVLIGAGALLMLADMLLSEALNWPREVSNRMRKVQSNKQRKSESVRWSKVEEQKPAKLTGASGVRHKRLLHLPIRSGGILLLTAALLLGLLYPTGYRVTYPGMTLNMNRYAHVEGGGSSGEVNGVLVFDRPAVAADWLYAKLFPLYSFEKIPEDEPPLTESYTQVVMMKKDANEVAAAVAMKKVGIGSGITSEGVRVIGIVKGSPAEQLLQAGDVIQKLNDQQVSKVDEMIGYMDQSVAPGESVDITLRRESGSIQVEVPTRASQEAPERAVFGVSVQTELHLDIPRSVDYSRYMAHIGGPSHGAMLTLALIDQLTPGGVTRGLKVAGTGTIEEDGSVGLIGGIQQKAYAISRTDADVFFVPAELEVAARGAAPDLNIVPVHTIDDILNWLARQKD